MTILDRYKLSDRYTEDDGRAFLTGVQALARVPISQVRVDLADGLCTAAYVSGYQGSPLGGFDQELQRALATVGDLPVVAKPAVNEELAAAAIMGTQLTSTQPDIRYDGVTGYWYGKAPGLDRASDAIRHANFAGASRKGGAVAFVGDDPACKSSTLPSSSDLALVDLQLPYLYPGDVQDVLDLAGHAVAVSRLSGLWSAMKIVTAVADGSGSVELDPHLVTPIDPDLSIGGRSHLHQVDGSLIAPHTNEMEREMQERRLVVARRYGVANALNRVTADPPNGWIGFVAAGYTYRELLEAFRRLGFVSLDAIEAAGIRLLQVRMPYPLDPDVIRRFAAGLDEVVVVEEQQTLLEWTVKDALFNLAERPLVVGARDGEDRPLIPDHGFLTADRLIGPVRGRLASQLADRLAPLPAEKREKTLIPLTVERAPYFCSGCPHNWGTKTEDGALVGAGIGCSGMTLLMDADRVGDVSGITCMGTEGAQWLGMEPFLERDHFVQNLGDGTLFHSGQLAIQAAIAAGVDMTYKLLYNGTVAMTGGQDPAGGLGVPELAGVLIGQGVSDIVITTDDVSAYDGVELPRTTKGGKINVWPRTRIVEAQEHLAGVGGVTVLIHDQSCAAEARRSRKRSGELATAERFAINHRLCEACGDCGEVSNCLSLRTIDTPLGPKTSIDQSSCNLDASCAEGDCPSFMTIQPGSDHEPGPSSADLLTGPPGDFPEPEERALGDRVNIRLAGIGGTGVVTAAQILGTAALFDGWEVRGLDQTGLSQKAGPVVSDLRLSRGGPAESNLVGEAGADTIIGFDLLVTASDRVLQAGAAGRTVVVTSSTETPTGDMIGDPDREYPALDQLMARVATASDASANRVVDAGRVVAGLLGDTATVNIFLIGVAIQSGTVPVTTASVERAIEVNGVAVDANRAAFDWGRQWVVDEASVVEASGIAEAGLEAPSVAVDPLPPSLAARVSDFGLDDELHELVSLLTADLVGYQSANYAGRYLHVLNQVIGAERSVDRSSVAFTEAAARGLHKLMAYKDEYEVARLLTGPEARATVRAVGGRHATVRWQLHPPTLRSMGRTSKLSIDARVGGPAMGLLARAKRLRGTALDPFARTEMRRAERAIITEYIAVIEESAEKVTAEHLDWIVELASAALDVRGYEQIKLDRIEVFRDRLATGRARLAALSPVGA